MLTKLKDKELVQAILHGDERDMKRFFDELAHVQATAAKLTQHFRTQVCTQEKNSNSF